MSWRRRHGREVKRARPVDHSSVASVLRRILFSIARACGERFFEIKLPRIALERGPLCSLGLNPAFDLLVLRDRQRSQWRPTASDPRRVVGLQLGSVLAHVVDDHIKLLSVYGPTPGGLGSKILPQRSREDRSLIRLMAS